MTYAEFLEAIPVIGPFLCVTCGYWVATVGDQCESCSESRS